MRRIHNLRDVVDAISQNYAYVIIDNEAGLEHLSRRTTRDVQHLLVVSDPSQRGMVAAKRIGGFPHEMNINIENTHLIVNRLPGGIMPEPLQTFIDQEIDFPLLGVIPQDDLVTEYEFSGKPIVEMDGESAVYQAVAEMMPKIV